MSASRNSTSFANVTREEAVKRAADLIPLLRNHAAEAEELRQLAPAVREGKLRLLATLGQKRTKGFPDVPTVKESGWDTITESPFGIGAPKNLDAQTTRILHDAFKKALDDPEFHKILDRYDQDVAYLNSEDYAKFVRKIYEEEGAVIKRMGLKL